MSSNFFFNYKESYCGHLYKCNSVPEERDRQRTINNICLAFLGSDPKQGNIYDVSAFLLRFGNGYEDIKVGVFCAAYFSNLNVTDNNKTNNVITPTSFACWFSLSFPLSRSQRYTQILTDVPLNSHAHTLVAWRSTYRRRLYLSDASFENSNCHTNELTKKAVNANLVWENKESMYRAVYCEKSSTGVETECDNFEMCIHSHFHPLLGIDLKWWLHECTTADHVIFLWDEDFRERKGREKGVHRPQAGNVKLWTIICWAKYNACQMNWSSTSKPQQLPHQNATEKSSVWICVRMCVFMHVAPSQFPTPSPLSHTHVPSATIAWSNYQQSNYFKNDRKSKKRRKTTTNIPFLLCISWHAVLRFDMRYTNDKVPFFSSFNWNADVYNFVMNVSN